MGRLGLAGALILAPLVSRVLGQQTAINCTNVHIIVARASTEQPGPGIIGAVARQVQSQVPAADIVAVDYPATLENYVQSQTAGVAAMTKLVVDYAAACPSSKLVLMGYSQGAQVTADSVCGATEEGFPFTQPLNSTVASKIAAIALMGDPSFVVGQPFNRGNATVGGIFHRQNTSSTCSAVASKMISFCDSGDTFCDSAGNTPEHIQIHLRYVQVYGEEATEFVVSKLKTPSTVGVSAAVPGHEVFASSLLLWPLVAAWFLSPYAIAI